MLESSDCVAFNHLRREKMRIWPFLYPPHGSSLQYLILLFFEQMLESFKPLDEGKNVNLAFSISSPPWLQSPVHRPVISRQKPTQTGSRRARLFHTNFKQVMYRQREGRGAKNRFREKPNTIEAKNKLRRKMGFGWFNVFLPLYT